MSLDGGGGESWFNAEVSRKVNNGEGTSFWNTKWRGDMILREKYPRLFGLSNQKEAKVADMWREGEIEVDWLFNWRRKLFVWEEGLRNELRLDLQGFVKSQGEDEWYWKLEDRGCFTVGSLYKKLALGVLVENERGEEENRVFAQIWKSPAPSKVVALSWKGLLNRLPTRVNLIRRNALPQHGNSRCVFCNEVDESTNHLFLHCKVTWRIWAKVQNWLEVNFIMPSNLFAHWRCWDALVLNRKELKRGTRLIWNTTIWVIWKVRNNIVFNNGSMDVGDVVDDILRLSWQWNLSRLKIQPCLYYEWRWNPRWCLQARG